MARTIRVAILAFFCVSTGYSQSHESDRLLSILQKELQRETTEFAKANQPPYFISFRVDEDERLVIQASNGSLVYSNTFLSRPFHVNVRVGDYQLDNSHPMDGMEDMFYGASGRTSLPLDDGDIAITRMLWEATAEQYESALQAYLNIKEWQVNKKERKKTPDFSREVPEKYYEPRTEPLASLVEAHIWEDKVRKLSKLFTADEGIIEGQVAFSLGRERRYYVSSEGASIVQNSIGTYVFVSASVRTDDDDVVPLHLSYYAPTPKELPSDQLMEADIQKMIATLLKLKSAPLAEPYTGPAVLDGAVAGVFFHEIFGHRVEGHRMRSELDGQTFMSKVNQRILPESMNVYCDPTQKKFADVHLNGVYAYDDEGIKSSRVNIVEKGTLKNFLMARSPLENFTHSNGHGRASAGMPAVSRQSNLFIDATKTKTSAELRHMLVKECQRQKKPYGYYFKEVVGGFTMTDRFSPNAFNIFPTEVYRVYVDGRPDELVRGVDLIGTPLAMFAEIAAVGDTHSVFTGFCGAESGYVPVSAISPSLFVRRIETQKKPRGEYQEQILPAPTEKENR